MASQDSTKSPIGLSSDEFKEKIDSGLIIFNFTMIGDTINGSLQYMINEFLLKRGKKFSEKLDQETLKKIEQEKKFLAYSSSDFFTDLKFINYLERISIDYGYEIFYLADIFDVFQKKYPDLVTRSKIFLTKVPVKSTSSSSGSSLYDCEVISHITDNLFLGSINGASSKDLLKEKSIQIIINITPEQPKYPDDFEYHNIPILDNPFVKISEHFDETYKLIKKAKESNKNVFVHCMAGISRSATIIIAYLMKENKMTLNKAYTFVKEKRRIIEPNFSFYCQLVEYEKTLN
jgi:hypothetical protein